MASVPAVITIESSDEDDDVICLGETCASRSSTTAAVCHINVESSSNSDKENSDDNSVIMMEDLPVKPDYKISTTKLQSLRKLMDKSNVGKLSKKLQQNSLKINKARLKSLRAVIKIELSNTPSAPPVRVKEEKMDTSSYNSASGCAFPNGFSSSQSSPSLYSELNLCSQILNSSPSSKALSPVKKLAQSPLEKYFVLSDKKRPSSKCQTNSPKKIRLSVQKCLEFATEPERALDSSKSLQEATVVMKTTVVAKRNDVVWPPTHVVLNGAEFLRKLYVKNQKHQCSSFVDMIESLRDEKFYYAAVKTLQRLTSSHTAPPSNLVWSVVADMLLRSRSRRTSVAIYCVLVEIHTRHPASCVAMSIEWKQLQALLKILILPSGNARNSQSLFNTNLVVCFVLDVLSSEMKSVALKSKATRITRLLSADHDMQKVKEVVTGLRDCLCNQEATSKSVTVGDNDGSSRTKGLPSSSHDSLDYFQTLLKFIIVSSTNKEYVAIRIANELMYLYIDLTTLCARVCLLRTLKSHLIRRYLIEVLLMNYCALTPVVLHSSDMEMSLHKIVLQDFRRCPPQRSECGNNGCSTPEEVEEYVTLLAYLLQSYIALHSKLQAYHGDAPSHKTDVFKQFSNEDVIQLGKLGTHVSTLRKRCERLVGTSGKLSQRTYLLLDLMTLSGSQHYNSSCT